MADAPTISASNKTKRFHPSSLHAKPTGNGHIRIPSPAPSSPSTQASSSSDEEDHSPPLRRNAGSQGSSDGKSGGLSQRKSSTIPGPKLNHGHSHGRTHGYKVGSRAQSVSTRRGSTNHQVNHTPDPSGSHVRWTTGDTSAADREGGSTSDDLESPLNKLSDPIHAWLPGQRRSSGLLPDTSWSNFTGQSNARIPRSADSPPLRASMELQPNSTSKAAAVSRFKGVANLLAGSRPRHPFTAQPSSAIFPLNFSGFQLTRAWGEAILVVTPVLGAAVGLYCEGGDEDRYKVLELLTIVALSIVYVVYRPFSVTSVPPPTSPTVNTVSITTAATIPPSSSSRHRAHSPSRETHNLHPSSKSTFSSATYAGLQGFVWGTDERNYRDCPDDGALIALLFGPLLSASLLLSTLHQLSNDKLTFALPAGWLIEPPVVLSVNTSAPLSPCAVLTSNPRTALEALAKSRRSLVSLSTVISLVLLLHLLLSRRREQQHLLKSSINQSVPGGVTESHPSRRIGKFSEKGSETKLSHWVPKSEWRRTGSVVALAFGVSLFLGILQGFMSHFGIFLWDSVSVIDIFLSSLFHQFSMYVCVRLARKGFTLGELGIVSQFSTALFMETINLTRARVSLRFLTTAYFQTYRLPTPLLIFQLALLPGSFLVGILLSPLLVLSRYISQRPVRRLRYPEQKERQRKALAAGFYGGTILIVGGAVGTWTRWQLGWRDPWVWVVLWTVSGQRWWTRLALLGYWGLLAVISVGGWEMQLTKARKRGPWSGISGPGSRQGIVSAVGGARTGSPAGINESPVERSREKTRGDIVDEAGTVGKGSTSSGVTPSGGSTEPVGSGYREMIGRVPVLSLNGRRKFFHGLAVLMFVPGLYVDPAFTHLAFSFAFASFVFVEYIRYFALYPFGASVHLFLNEFLDHKDSGTAILSHFYLLTGCAMGAWLESPSPILSYVGVLTLGIGDAIASVVGRSIGKRRWSFSSGKTIEGSMAFFVGVYGPALILRLFGIIETLNYLPFALSVVLSCLLEALSFQNDNLILPLYAWSVGCILGV
ncbi:dolichol kinase [Phaffia rhodozyma]|uniref:dolichol kinase n=1 Tax=Phaffia rhodozyma TaxID=264483 RepID=A0A0F7SJ50_PHARH|nr:dolichol kinase [Phaffia rhodozyma]